MTSSRSALRMPPALRVLTAALLVALGLSALVEGGVGLDGVLAGTPAEVLYDGVIVGSAVLCLGRALLHAQERTAWSVMGAGMLAYALGNVVWSVVYANVAAAPYPSAMDALWILFYPAAYVAVILLARARAPHLSSRLWLDGLIALLVACAISAAVVVDAVAEATGGAIAAVVTSLAYPVGDMILTGLVVGAMAAARGKLDRTWLCLSIGALIFAGVDSVYGYQVAEGTYVANTLLDILWPLGTLIIGLAAWQPGVRTLRPDQSPSVVVPVVSALTALGVLLYDHFARISDLALVLVGAAMVAVVGRLALTHRQSRANLALTQRQATTDALTGLGNRFALMRDLELAAAGSETRHVLLLFDLDGFKNYNDAYGHPAGDALLRRLGDRLAAAVAGRATAYRMGGDEFCLLARCAPGEGPEALVTAARAALKEHGEGFAVGCSGGHALLPDEAGDAPEALRTADRRLYAEKHSGRVSARLQSAGVLRRALDEWDAELGCHGADVAALAAGVARRLGLDDDEVERVAAAAELHDVGKIAVPRDILKKRGPLDEAEWAFMRRHTVIGERIVQAAPALAGVGRLIRSSHERWDGGGYPDGLAAEQIPLGSQIVFICDAFDAMTTDRSYRRGMPEAAALEELRRNAGTQFAPAVVAAFLAERAALAAVPAFA